MCAHEGYAGKSGCEELSTPPLSVPVDEWVHVSASFDAAGDAYLHVDGRMLASTSSADPRGRSRIEGGVSPIVRPISRGYVHVGEHADGTHRCPTP